MRITITAFAYLTSVAIGGAAVLMRWKVIALASLLRMATHVIPSGGQFFDALAMQPLLDLQTQAHRLGLTLLGLTGAIAFFALITLLREESK